MGVPLWFDLAMIGSAAWTGMMLGFLSLFYIHSVLRHSVSAITSWFFIFIVNLLSGFGMYLGRFLRWNSWDIVTNFQAMTADIGSHVINPQEISQWMGMSVVFGVFFSVFYAVIWTVMDHK